MKKRATQVQIFWS